jgi:Asp-tRNA(Asn)/Glu-tRNA(Gln) amidotransferase A subunit family amidase
MTHPSDDLSRRSFLKATLAGVAVSLTKVLGMAETDQKPQRTTRVSGGQSDELTRMSLQEAAGLIRAKKISPVELTSACLARIDRFNPALNAFITITAESAMKQARDAEAEVTRGKWRGPLHGIPIALKDLFDTAGVRTTAASGVFKDRIPAEDAEVVRRLKNAGAVLLGNTNMHAFALVARHSSVTSGRCTAPGS